MTRGQSVPAVRRDSYLLAWPRPWPIARCRGRSRLGHISQQAGRSAGLIDFGEIRGGDPWYDLGHSRVHDGEALPTLTLPWLLTGHGEVAPLPADAAARISVASLLIAVRALARAARKNPTRIARHQGLVAIRRDLDLLGA